MADSGSASEPDIELDVQAEEEYNMGLHPDLTNEQVQSIVDDANAQGAPQDAPVQNNKKRKLKRNVKSEVWKHFKKGTTQDDGSYDATCNYCGEVYPMGNSRGTGSLHHHIDKGCDKVPERHKRTRLQQMLEVQPGQVEGENQIAVWSFDQATCRTNLAVMVIVHDYPFNIVTHHYFRVFIKSLQPEFRGFMALTCHYIDDKWRIRKRVINFCPLPSPHTGKHIAEALFHMLLTWNLDKRAFSLVLDNASSNDACIRELLNGPLKESLPVDGSVFHQRCGCHILNLVVQDGLSVATNEISKIRETMKYLRHSQARMERFRLAASQARAPNKKPAWDVATRWNSTYLMLELAVELRPAIVSTQAGGASSKDMMDDIRAGLKEHMRQVRTAEPAKSELEEYLAEALDETGLDDEFDILAWWRLKVPKYPVLSRLTRDILAVPASTVASESTFSNSGRTLSPVRSCLNDESMEALICAQDWLRARVTENGGDIGAPMWTSAEPVYKIAQFLSALHRTDEIFSVFSIALIWQQIDKPRCLPLFL
ncbi:hypothetical protein LUZ61_010657 [Rhynchospora tenuis]|uniref:BED-type domain-containing protein n=1 Tax=Rhynchospora tenuis TaxID=198213 RepID=A0AAD5ZZI3_9POAL|nr:hypothetical protein LUZ61_010657 [Rhynchospora tenuis]